MTIKNPITACPILPVDAPLDLQPLAMINARH